MADENLASIIKCYFWKKLGDKEEFVRLDLKKGAEKGSFRTSYYFPDPENEISEKDREIIKECMEELEATRKLEKGLKENFIILYLAMDSKDNKTAAIWANKVYNVTDKGENTDFVIPIDGDFNNAKAMLEVENEDDVSTRKKSKAVKAEEASMLHYMEYKFSKFVNDFILQNKRFIAFVKHKKKKMGDDVTNVDTYYIYPTFKALKNDKDKRELFQDLKAFAKTGKNLPGAIGASAYAFENNSEWQKEWTGKIVKEFKDSNKKNIKSALKLYGII